MGEKFLCVHGHFYQPPRENPWMEEIEPQESVRPFPNWNERIYFECYRPNAKARVLDDKGHVVDIVNNFKSISFNFGPTLLAWIETQHPDIYDDILIADRMSVSRHNGHGNAIAQVYNHMIMPLANRRDKKTQVRWGVQEFRHRFKRDPESIWLAETACNEETLEVLVEEKIKYIILEPQQAEAVRWLGTQDWRDVTSGDIDPKKPYRCFLKNAPEKFIDIFFYDGPVSKAMGFDDILFDAKRTMDRIEKAMPDTPDTQLFSVATDGETFGHHKPFADRVLAYLLDVEAAKRGFTVINFGEYLEKFPPKEEVRLKAGDNGEGTSWSCIHGVKRWKEHCGCRGGGPGEWNQNWRKPLREALDWLRDKTAQLFETAGGKFLKDPWFARDEYIEVILDRSVKSIAQFFVRHALRPLEKHEQVLCLKLLEMQRHAMLMYTSCGWFFTELSGIETVQVIEYSARTVELAREISGESLEGEFLALLAKAKSNLAEFKDGKTIYERVVMPHRVSFPQVASFYAINSLVDDTLRDRETLDMYAFKIDVQHQRKEAFGDLDVSFGRLTITSKITGEMNDLIFVAAHMGLYDFRCSVRPAAEFPDAEEVKRSLFGEMHALHLVEIIRRIDHLFGEKYFSLKDLPIRERMKIISLLTHEMIEKISTTYEHLYDENRRMNEIYRSINLPIPEQIRYAAEHTLKRRLKAAVEELGEYGFNPKKASALQRVLDHAKSFGLEVKAEEVSRFLSEALEKRTEQMAGSGPSADILAECINIIKIARKIKVELILGGAQENLFNMVKRWIANPEKMPAGIQELSASIVQLLTELNINPEAFKKILQPVKQ